MEWMADPNIWLALVTLTALEIVLGIDNIIFISIVSGNLPPEQRPLARRLGLIGAVVMRLGLLVSIFWLTRLTAPLFAIGELEISTRDLILIGGGLFLLAKSTMEIHTSIEEREHHGPSPKVATMGAAVFQIMVLDAVFSLDSVITAMGMAEELWVMAVAIILAVAFMLIWVDAISRFVDEHPTFKMLALSFLVLIGVALIGEGLEFHIPKPYIYFAMGYAFAVELLNMRIRKNRRKAKEG